MPDEPRAMEPPIRPVWALRSRRVVTPTGVRDAAVIIAGEKIVAVVAPGDIPSDCPVEDALDRVVLPGLVDAHVHINEPGRTEWEGFETATRAAAAGGITTLFDMPLNSSPVTTTTEALELKLDSARGKLWVDCGFYGGIVPGVRGQIGAARQSGSGGLQGVSLPLGHRRVPERGREPTSGPRCPSWPAPGCRSWCTRN